MARLSLSMEDFFRISSFIRVELGRFTDGFETNKDV